MILHHMAAYIDYSLFLWMSIQTSCNLKFALVGFDQPVQEASVHLGQLAEMLLCVGVCVVCACACMCVMVAARCCYCGGTDERFPSSPQLSDFSCWTVCRNSKSNIQNWISFFFRREGVPTATGHV